MFCLFVFVAFTLGLFGPCQRGKDETPNCSNSCVVLRAVRKKLATCNKSQLQSAQVLALVCHRLLVGLSCFLRHCSGLLLLPACLSECGELCGPSSSCSRVGEDLATAVPLSQPALMQYENISYILREWNLCWTSKPTLIIYFEVT